MSSHCNHTRIGHRPRRERSNNLSHRCDDRLIVTPSPSGVDCTDFHSSRGAWQYGIAVHSPSILSSRKRDDSLLEWQTLGQTCSRGDPGSAICVQRLDDSLNSAIHTRYRSLLRSSSMHEPRDPPSEVVSFCHTYKSTKEQQSSTRFKDKKPKAGWFGSRPGGRCHV